MYSELSVTAESVTAGAMVGIFDLEYDVIYYIFKALFIIGTITTALFLTFFFRLDHDLLLWLHGRSNHSHYFKNKRVWITGGSSGIGEYLAYELTELGAKVAISARREAELTKVANSCRGINAPAIPIVFDQLDYSKHKSTFDLVVQKLGGLDIIVINAGRSQRALAVETDLQVTKDIIDLNVVSYVNLTKIVLPHFQKQRSGTIVATSSVAGKIGSTLSTSYSLTKWAINGYFNALRTEVADDGISVCVVCPGPVATDIIKQAFSAKAGAAHVFNNVKPDEEEKMSPARHATLMARAIAAKQDECWISPHPYLLMTYLAQYMPVTWNFMNRWIGSMRIKAYKAGVETMSFSGIWAHLRGTDKAAPAAATKKEL